MWRKESSEPRHGKYLEPLGFGETQSLWRRVIPGPPGPGESQSQPVIWATGPQARLLGPEGGRAAQRTLRNRRDGTARLGEAAASHTCSGLVLLCPTGQKPRRTDTPPRPFQPTARGQPGSDAFRGRHAVMGWPAASSPARHTVATSGTPGRYARYTCEGASSSTRSARARGRMRPTSSRRRARAPPAVAAQTASSVVIRISRTASATASGMLEVKQDPGLQSVARATVAPASSSRRASGYGFLVENSTPGSSVATVPPPASAATSASVR